MKEDDDLDQTALGKNARASRRIKAIDDAKKSQEEGLVDDERNVRAEQ